MTKSQSAGDKLTTAEAADSGAYRGEVSAGRVNTIKAVNPDTPVEPADSNDPARSGTFDSSVSTPVSGGGGESARCPLCGSGDSEELFMATDHLVSSRQFMIRQCNRCSMAWTHSPPPEVEAAGFYLSHDYISHSDKKRSLSDYLYHLARSLMLKRKHKIISAATGLKQGKLVDIGSGTGYFAAFMQKKGWDVTGVEISREARTYSVERHSITVMAPEKMKKIADHSADSVTLWHVLEHLYKPDEWMGQIKRILSKEGKCIIALPNFASSDACWFGSDWAALDVPRHLWHFTPEALKLLAGENGLQYETMIPLPLDLFYISYLSYRNSGVRMPLLRGILTGAWLSLLTLFQRDKASSLIYIFSVSTHLR